MSSPQPVVYVYYGWDEPTLKNQLDAFCTGLGDPSTADLNTSRLDGSTIQTGDIDAAAGTLPFLSEFRLVLIDNLTDSANGRGIIEKLPETIAALPEWARVVFVETGLEGTLQRGKPGESSRMASRRPALKKLVDLVESEPRGLVRAFEFPSDTRKWIIDRAGTYQAQIEPQAASVLAARINEDLRLADVELAKLATYTNGERPISAADVELLTPYTPEAGIFDMVDALGQRNGQLALRLLKQLLSDNNPPLMVFGMIIRQYRLLLQMREMLDGGQSAASAGKAVGIRYDGIAKKLARQAQGYSLETYEQIYHYLLKTDLEIKTGVTEPELALEALVARLAGSD
ncbi:MAG: DNA polymerase III subunit delta [Anaerolineae bacterium]|nr:DNA polymerase III subunit delta [Anaerolineae bacterium]